MKAMLAALQHFSTWGMPLVFAAVSFIAMVLCARAAWSAWRDVVRLDGGKTSLQEMAMRPMLQRLRPTDELEIRRLRTKLVQAGLRDEHAITRFTLMRLWGLGGAAVSMPLLLGVGMSGSTVILLGALLLACAYFLPDTYVRRLIESRQARISRALPSTIDMMVLCLDVGLSVEASFERVTLEMRGFEPLMADEAQQMVGEIAAGLSFANALKRMAERIGLEDLLTLSRLISQAATLGASVATALREYSESANTKRILGLEERAGKISSLMVMPITLCMLPATMIALVGPAIIMLAKALSGV